MCSCLLVAPLVLATGCGSSNKATTSQTASTSASTGQTGATGVSGKTSTTATTPKRSTSARSGSAPSRSSGGTTGPPLAPGYHAPTTTATTPQPKLSISKEKEEKIRAELRRLRQHPPKPVARPTLARVPHAKQYPAELQTRFLKQCTASRESTATCECLIAKFEESNVVKEQSIAEFVYFEATRHRGVPQPARIAKRVTACAHA